MFADTLQQLCFQSLPERAIALCEPYRDKVKQAQQVLQQLPGEDLDALFYNPSAETFVLRASADFNEAVTPTLAKIAAVAADDDVPVGDWIPVLYGFLAQKRAFDERLLARVPGQLAMAFPNPITRNIPAGGSPLVSMLAGGLVGAGLGYGAGTLGEKLLPERWERGRLRKTLAVLGAAGLAAPGALGTAIHLQQGKSVLAPSPWFVEPVKVAAEKIAILPGTGAEPPPLSVQEFLSTIWTDPRVAGPLTTAQQTAAAGLVTGAAYDDGRRTAFVTPGDIARMAAGMGSGYLSGMLVGKALGALVGMPDDTQDKLKRTGMYAGVVANLLPIAFGF
jgi:hypothetical protein